MPQEPTCGYCGKVLVGTSKNPLVSHRKRDVKHKKFCNHSCSQKARWERGDPSMRRLMEVFKVRPHPNLGKRHSDELKHKMSLARRGKTVGEHNPNWKGGIAPERECLYAHGTWKDLARFIRLRDGNECQRCGQPKAKHIHHIIPFSCTRLRMEQTNLVVLCPACHVWVHGRKNINQEFLTPIVGARYE